MKFTKKLTTLLAAIVVKTRAGEAEFVADSKDLDKLVDNGFAVVDGEADIHGNFPLKSTQLGYDWFDEQEQANAPVSETNETSNTMSKFEIKTGALPQNVNKRGSKYPFADLPAPQPQEDGSFDYAHFFVPDGDEEGSAQKSLSSRASAMSREYGKKVGEETYTSAKTGEEKTRDIWEYERRFKSVKVEGGANVYRVDNTLEK